MMTPTKKKAIVIGAGPAGLTAGLELLRTEKFTVSLLERDKGVGGLSRTTEFKKCRFDIGPHHFITNSPKIDSFLKEMMSDDLPKNKRFTRLYYRKRFFYYPLQPLNAVLGLGLVECIRNILSYLWIRLFPIKEVKTFQDFVVNRFGHRLFVHFFKTYTEKLWGIPCDKISAAWAAQRIKSFSLSKAIFYAFVGRFSKKNSMNEIFDTQSDEFYYPSLGAGTFWERVCDRVTACDGAHIALNTDVASIEHDGQRITAVATRSMRAVSMRSASAVLQRHEADYFLSSMPLRDLILSLDPVAPTHVIQAARFLRYRALVTVNLIVKKSYIGRDHWIYIHEKDLKVVRIDNMNNFSVKMTDHPSRIALCLEYFTFVGDPFWNSPDYELIELGKKELQKMGFARASEVLDGFVIRTPDAYPIYDEHYKEHVGEVTNYLSQFSNLFLIGRNGQHRYTNMDVAMLSAMDAVERIITVENSKPGVHTQKVQAASSQPSSMV